MGAVDTDLKKYSVMTLSIAKNGRLFVLLTGVIPVRIDSDEVKRRATALIARAKGVEEAAIDIEVQLAPGYGHGFYIIPNIATWQD